MKKIIRALFKIPFTFMIVPYKLMIIMVGSCILFWEWLYEDDNTYTRQIIAEESDDIIKWFTTL